MSRRELFSSQSFEMLSLQLSLWWGLSSLPPRGPLQPSPAFLTPVFPGPCSPVLAPSPTSYLSPVILGMIPLEHRLLEHLRWLFAPLISLGRGFLTPALLIFGAGSSLVAGGCPVHCRVLSSKPDLYPLNSHSAAQCDSQKCPQAFTNAFLGGPTTPGGEPPI